MKHVVLMSELKGSDIRPPELFSRLKELSLEESSVYFGDPSSLVDVSCPACESPDKIPVFEKHGFQYHQCAKCKSVFVSPRPSEDALAEYHQNSEAAQFRREYYLGETAEARRFHLLRPRANWIGRIVDEVGNPRARGFADLGTIYPFIFDEVKRLNLFDDLYSVNPSLVMGSEDVADNMAISQDSLHDLGAVTAFEQLEHEFSPYNLIKMAFDMLAAGGVLFLTTRTISGFDLQILWDKAPYIFVPEHLNLLSIKGIKHLINRTGFHLVELSTPGQLDVELVLRATLEDPRIKLPSFIEYILNQRGAETHADLQKFLQKNRLSSHVQVAAIRKGA